MEFEKLFAGAGASSVSDGGTFQRMYGTWLNWTQSRKSDVFVVATTNSVQSIPAPALRRGRFDKIFYVGLPGPKQREEIFTIHLKKRGWDPGKFDINVKALAQATPDRSGSEIEQIVLEGIILKCQEDGFSLDNPIKTDHLMRACKEVETMADLNPDEVKGLLAWAKKRGVMSANKDTNENNLKVASLSKAAYGEQAQPQRVAIVDEEDL